VDILFLNNYYYLRGGSERVFHEEMRVLQEHGHNVIPFCRAHPEDPESVHSEYFPPHFDTARLRASFSSLPQLREFFYSQQVRRNLERLLTIWQPEIAHAHNIYGRITGSALTLLRKRDIPTLLTLHDYKVICPTYLLLSNEKICEACKGKHFFHASLKACHKGNRISSTLYAAESYFNALRGTYRKDVTHFISPSKFLRDKMIQYGWAQDRITIVPNFVESDRITPNYTPGNYVLYLGRLSAEKGTQTLLNAFRQLHGNTQLVFAGTGPLADPLQEQAQGDSRVRFAGYLSGDDLQKTIAGARALIIPSEWYENAPMSILEAMAAGKPVIGANIGGIPEMICEEETGLLFEPGNIHDLAETLNRFLSFTDARVQLMGQNARHSIETNNSSQRHFELLTQIYNKVLGRTGKTR